MSDARTQELRNRATTLRIKASTGVVATAAARDLVAIVPASLEKAVEEGIAKGELQQRWEKALHDAHAHVGPDPTAEDVAMAALVDVLAWHRGVAKKALCAYLERIEGDRRAAEGHAAGIEEVLGVLSAE